MIKFYLREKEDWEEDEDGDDFEGVKDMDTDCLQYF
jgi:hypothetical protein